MDSFENAFRLGIQAAQQSEFQRQEVARVLKEFSTSLEKASAGTLHVEIKKSKNVLDAILSGFTAAGPSSGWGLFVTKKIDPSSSIQVAAWKQSPEGFPCWLTYASKEIACLDADSLQDELMRLAATPQMGEAVLKLGPPMPN